MSEKSLSADASKGTEFASESLSYDVRKTGAAPPDNQEIQNEPASEKLVIHPGEAPDGGLTAWLVVVAFGLSNSWGVFQAYYEENLLRHTSPSVIAWIGSVQYALVYLPALVTGRLFDLGYFKIPCFAASCVFVVCTFLIAECTQYLHFFLIQGLSIGVCCGIIVGPALVAVSHWFYKKRGLALSLTAIGASCRSTVFPVVAQSLIPLIGFEWTVRVFGFILIATLGMGNIFLKRRLPPVNVRGGLFNLKVFRNAAYSIFCISGIMAFLGLYTALTYMSVSAVAIGIPKKFSFDILAIANASSTFGRVSAGLLGDKVGALNTMAAFTAVAGIMTFAWPFAKNEIQLIVISSIYGFSTGGYVSLFAVAAVAMGKIEDAGRRVGMFMSLAAFGAISGPPISGAISSASGGFFEAGYYAGGIIMCAVVLLLLARYLHLGGLWGKC
ncbi:major facilitator superfamily domain-containing protein [Suillus subaureus]|uniref:Major facilitator superfamily domain-containing protein n=1 Tax=Suillus subaureus TaxID=48587 RepID=A0A9P7E9F2_9AGAM|nr:major facilitator superfamily domain-containing protein [Suillus subaureus]KAG1815197.1 major facilitator superfamily domain-containing protein [Suillus subaureus]